MKTKLFLSITVAFAALFAGGQRAAAQGTAFAYQGRLTSGGGAANGLYSVAGAILTLKTTGMPAWLRYWAWATWTAGFLLTLCTLADSTAGIAVSTTVLMALFCPWAALLGRALR